MASRRLWRAFTIGSLVAVTIPGVWGCSSARSRHSRIVVVEDLGKGTTKDIVISKKRKQKIQWPFPSGLTIDHIEITLRSGQHPSGRHWPPFQKCGADPNVCSIPCDVGHRRCKTGPIHPDLEPPVIDGLAYDCRFILSSGAPADPGIRILP